ncbi:MAG: protein translocase subunit SecD [Chitinivibrionales bacterium]|nr:protein translocase subunit SecD [Chitinivibrionales bacterium]
MKRNSPYTVIFILLLVGAAIWYLYPSFAFYSKTPDQRTEAIRENPAVIKKVINLGLDLQGGMRLLLEVDRSALADKNDKDVLDRAYTKIENRVNGLGVAEPTIQKQGNNRLIVELPGLKDVTVAKQVIGSTAQLQFQLLREPAELEKAIRVIDKVLQGKRDTSKTDSTKLDSTQMAQKQAQVQAEKIFTGSENEDSSEVSDTTEESDVETLSDYLVAVGSQIGVREEDRGKVVKILSNPEVQEALRVENLGNSIFLWGHSLERQGALEYRPLYYVKRKAELTGDIIKDAQNELAQGGMNVGQSVVSLELNRDGARKFGRVTGANVHKFLAIVLDSTVYSAPQIKQKISQGRAQIEGNFTLEESKGLAVVLRAGALPAPVKIIEERVVGPSLGQDSINLAIRATILASILVFLFMIIYYGLSGLIADIALVLNVVFVLAIMASIGNTLTLPGVGGLILTVGMAVDANVIIFERIREELRLGKTVRSAVDAGYDRAFLTIFDSNITTVFTALILIWLGTSSVKGFGVTMAMGIAISMFTGLFCTHVVFDFISASKNLKKLSI